jgi:hypothetical protein
MLMREYGYTKAELEEMDWEQYVYLIGIAEAEAYKHKKDLKKAQDDAKNKRGRR